MMPATRHIPGLPLRSLPDGTATHDTLRLARHTPACARAADPDSGGGGAACALRRGLSSSRARVPRRVCPAWGRALAFRGDSREACHNWGASLRRLPWRLGRASRHSPWLRATGLVTGARSLLVALLVCQRGPRLPRDIDRSGPGGLPAPGRIRARALAAAGLNRGSGRDHRRAHRSRRRVDAARSQRGDVRGRWRRHRPRPRSSRPSLSRCFSPLCKGLGDRYVAPGLRRRGL